MTTETKNILELLNLPTYSMQELISAHQDWLRYWKDSMSWDDYRYANGLAK